MITEYYVSFETAKLLKEKGFEQEPDYATSWYANQYYKNSCQGEWFEGEHQIIDDIDDKCNISCLSERGIFIPAPTLQTAMKWLREAHNIHVVPKFDFYAGYYTGRIYDGRRESTAEKDDYIAIVGNKTYEEAGEAAIKYCLENLI